ncbi:hypothetical protein NQ318_002945 [Aromia moschata]|uniref:Uncharacterized protein n=1 Tax=Aromia moschata TaxID=1265417 RepID=A0AAV8X6R8_9CUCU|nr:hypothetical protein NQ318_002945 [Aromia moschata]
MSRRTSQHTVKHESRKSKSKIIQPLSSKSLSILAFQFKLETYCMENRCRTVPDVEVLGDAKETQSVQGVQGAPAVFITFKAGDDEELDKILFKNFPLETGMVLALQSCFEDGIRITVLKYATVLRVATLRFLVLNRNLNRFEFCNMTAEHVEMLSDILASNDTITELSVNGNPVPEQNFHLLLRGTKLLSLSLKCCCVDRLGMERIAGELSRPFDCPLLHLNLASNRLFDEGAASAAALLRANRTLLSLNLSDNKIYDGGCRQLTQPLQHFPLDHCEIVERRRIRYALLRRNVRKKYTHRLKIEYDECSLMKAYREFEISLELSNSATTASTVEINKGSSSIRDMKQSFAANQGKPSRASIKSSKRSSKDKGSICSQDTLTGKKLLDLEQGEPDITRHPFVQDSYEEDVDIYCRGNDALINLSLCYNRITREGLCDIIQMLYYQRAVFPNDRGISRISLEGNDLADDCERELQEFDDLINRRSRKSSTISNKRSSVRKGSSRPSVA